MEEYGLQLQPTEKVVKQYDFITRAKIQGKLYEAEDSLIVTNKRVVRRIAGESTLLQDEMLLEDVNQVNTKCHTSRTVTQKDNKSKVVAMFVIAAILLILAVIGFVKVSTSMGIGALVVAIILVIVALISRKKTKIKEETSLRIVLTPRGTNSAFMVIEKILADESVAVTIANEIGAMLLKARDAKASSSVYDD